MHARTGFGGGADLIDTIGSAQAMRLLVRAIEQTALAQRMGLSPTERRTIERNGFVKTRAHPAHREASDRLLALSGTRQKP